MHYCASRVCCEIFLVLCLLKNQYCCNQWFMVGRKIRKDPSNLLNMLSKLCFSFFLFGAYLITERNVYHGIWKEDLKPGAAVKPRSVYLISSHLVCLYVHRGKLFSTLGLEQEILEIYIFKELVNKLLVYLKFQFLLAIILKQT